MYYRTLMSIGLLIGTIILTAVPRQAHADYVNPDTIIQEATESQWLYNAAKSGVKAGAKAVSKAILTNVGEALVNSFSPQLADILFGRSDAFQQRTQLILDAIQAAHGDLAERNRVLLDEINDMFESDLIATFATASNSLRPWLASDSPLKRWESGQVALLAMRDFDHIRNTIETYIMKGGKNPQIHLQHRLRLMPLHITAAQLAVTTSRFYWGIITAHTAFLRSPYGANEGQFDEWVARLTAAELTAIEAMEPDFTNVQNNTYQQVLSFYDTLANQAQDPIATYVEEMFTPLVDAHTRFKDNRNLFDVPEVVTNPGSWQPWEGQLVAILDGQRWYYYVDIPYAACLDGFAFHALTAKDSIPWSEVTGAPAASDCNRFWIVEPSLKSSAWPNTYLASFDGYDLWFPDLREVYDLHKILIRGDLLRAVYGPVSLILDRMYTEQFGSTRPPNQWDQVFVEYDRQIALLGISDSYATGRSYNPFSTVSYFSQPTIDGFRLDLCREWDSNCGRPAASAFCQSQGYAMVGDWGSDPFIGAEHPTKIIGTGQTCDQWFCGGFTHISCVGFFGESGKFRAPDSLRIVE